MFQAAPQGQQDVEMEGAEDNVAEVQQPGRTGMIDENQEMRDA